MLKKRAQGLSMNIIVLAVIGLIILVVLIAIFTGKLNFYTSGVRELTTCENTCKNIGYTSGRAITESSCINDVKGRSIPGKFSDISGTSIQEIDDGETIEIEKKCCCISI